VDLADRRLGREAPLIKLRTTTSSNTIAYHPPSLLHEATMFASTALGRNASRAFRLPFRTCPSGRRNLAAPASGGFSYESSEANGVKYASRDLPGATTTLAVVAKAGTRYQKLPGYSDALEKYAFKVRTFEETKANGAN